MKKQNKLFFVVGVLMVLVLALSACSAPKSEASGDVPKPSNAGGPSEAVNLTGNAQNGAQVFAANCVACHGEEGKVGIANPGSDDGNVPSLNPVDPALKNADEKVFAQNLDLFIEHGSTPEGDGPALTMTAFGANNILDSQQIADVIAYVISLNK